MGTEMLAHDILVPIEEADEEAFADAPSIALPPARDAPSFSPLELTVIGIGERDRPVLLRSDGRLARLGRFLFGIEAPASFADRRLEALRLLANALRHGRRPDAPIAAALASGVTPRQIEILKARNHG